MERRTLIDDADRVQTCQRMSLTHKTSVSQGDLGRDRNTAKLSKYIILGASAYFETEGVFRQITEILFQNNWNIGIG